MHSEEMIDYVALEESLNNLLSEEKIRRLRNGLTDFVMDRLRKRVLARLKSAGMDEKLEKDYLGGEKDAARELYRILQDKEKGLGLSQANIRQLRRIEKGSREAMLEALRTICLKEERIRFCKEANIASKVWGEFVDCDKLTGEATLHKLRTGLGLTAEEIREFNSRVIVHVFAVDKTLRDKVFALREKTGMSLADFQIYACIGKEAWEAFYELEEETVRKLLEENKPIQKNTSQKTLLKLVIGFGLAEDGAWDFMDTAKSAFVVRRDLVFLSCVRCGYKDPLDVQVILDFFAEDAYGQTYYSNPYD